MGMKRSLLFLLNKMIQETRTNEPYFEVLVYVHYISRRSVWIYCLAMKFRFPTFLFRVASCFCPRMFARGKCGSTGRRHFTSTNSSRIHGTRKVAKCRGSSSKWNIRYFKAIFVPFFPGNGWRQDETMTIRCYNEEKNPAYSCGCDKVNVTSDGGKLGRAMPGKLGELTGR